jgi:hypothetical protein
MRWLSIVCLSAWFSSTCSAADTAPSKIDFARDIRPILSDKCFACHGPDAVKRKAGLRLDIPESTFGMLPSHARAVVPGKLDDSEMISRITSKDDQEIMPPRKFGKSLTSAEIDRLKAWVQSGASYPKHWAFVSPTKAPTPTPKIAGWARNPIDAFVIDRLTSERLKPSPEAERSTLLRRLSLDLIGLPPPLEELDTFLQDKRPDAYERQVDRLLASPHYGERWARLWLDAARYADSDGYEKDKSRVVWSYRDWVINAYNKDLPYDQFIIDQIAGDLRANPTQDQIVATGFLRNSMINEEGGVDPEQFRMEAMFDRMDAIGKGVLGLTIQCAQCHSHKYDPLTHEEYYQMFAFLNNASESNQAVYTIDQEKQRADMFREIAKAEASLKASSPDWLSKMSAWESSVRSQPDWQIVRPEVDEISTGGCKYQLKDDGSLLESGYAPTKHTVKLIAKTNAKLITGVRLELLNDADLPLSGPGRSVRGTGALSEFEVLAASVDAPTKTTKLKIISATADVNPAEAPLESIYSDKSEKRRTTGPVAFAIDGKDDTAWSHDIGPERRNLPRKAVFVFDKAVENAKGTILTFLVKQNHGGWNSDDNQNYNLGRFRLSITSASNPTADPLPTAVRAILHNIPQAKRTKAQTEAIFSFWRTTVREWSGTNELIESLWKSHPEGSTQLVLHERERNRKTSMLERGDFLKPVKAVTPGVPAFLHPLQTDGPINRLTFAKWLVDRKSPTTARSVVNRLWQAYFGTGIVSTTEELGSQSEPPSHPQLLDWLAVELMDRGWSQKAIHRLIVTSSTYRQSSKITPDRLAKDPYNRLLARGPRFRVDAEIVRDIALSSSGLLSPKVGGPSVYPPAPEFLFMPPVSYGPKIWAEASKTERARRAIYTFRYRSVPYPALAAFDAPNGDFACVRRSRSNTPLQALTTLNEPLFLDCARSLALRTIQDGGKTDQERLNFAFRRCVSRSANEAETKALLTLLHNQAKRFERPSINPWELAASDPKLPPTLPKGATSADLAAWTAVSRVLLNLDETITKE